MNSSPNPYRDFYRSLTPEERERSYLVIDLDLVIGGRAELILELLSLIAPHRNEVSLTLRHVIREAEVSLGMPAGANQTPQD